MQAGRRDIQADTVNNFFDPSPHTIVVRKRFGTTTSDTLGLMVDVIGRTSSQTARLAAWLRNAHPNNQNDILRGLWAYLYKHIQYQNDRPGYEEIRHPARSWMDKTAGVDCDDFSVLVSSVLTNLKIPHALRMTKYAKVDGKIVAPGTPGAIVGEWQHIYVIVPKVGQSLRLRANYYTLDCVTDQYDYEVPYAQNQDRTMQLLELQGLSGLEGASARLRRDTRRSNTVVGQNSDRIRKSKVGRVLQKTSKGFMKIAPATAILRNAWLTAMKTNLKGAAARLRIGYMTLADAQRVFGINAQQYGKVRGHLVKIQNTFVKLGGEAKNLKSAILSGKGNRDGRVKTGLAGGGMLFGNVTGFVVGGLAGHVADNDPVSGLGYVEEIGDYDEHYDDGAIEGISDLLDTPKFDGLLGMGDVAGLGQLGVVGAGTAAVLATVTAVAGALANIIPTLRPSEGASSQPFADDSDAYNMQEGEDEALDGLDAAEQLGLLKKVGAQVKALKANLQDRKQTRNSARDIMAQNGVKSKKVERKAAALVSQARKQEAKGDATGAAALRRQSLDVVKSASGTQTATPDRIITRPVAQALPTTLDFYPTQRQLSLRVRDKKTGQQTTQIVRLPAHKVEEVAQATAIRNSPDTTPGERRRADAVLLDALNRFTATAQAVSQGVQTIKNAAKGTRSAEVETGAWDVTNGDVPDETQKLGSFGTVAFVGIGLLALGMLFKGNSAASAAPRSNPAPARKPASALAGLSAISLV